MLKVASTFFGAVKLREERRAAESGIPQFPHFTYIQHSCVQLFLQLYSHSHSAVYEIALSILSANCIYRAKKVRHNDRSHSYTSCRSCISSPRTNPQHRKTHKILPPLSKNLPPFRLPFQRLKSHVISLPNPKRPRRPRLPNPQNNSSRTSRLHRLDISLSSTNWRIPRLFWDRFWC